jgi:chromosome partitioning protein
MIISAFSPKGGAGKTTTAVNVAAMLASSGKSILLIDLEADLNASISLGVRPTDANPSIADVLVHQRRAVDAVREISGIRNLALLTGSPDLATMELRLRNVRQPERRLADVVRPLASQFDVIVIDAPPVYSLLGLSVAVAADELIVPLRAEYLSLESLAQFLRWYRDRHTERRGLARITGILLTMVDYRRQATREIVDIIRLHNRRGVFTTEIPPDPRVAEAPSHGVPVVTYAPSSRASVAYGQLTSEILRRAARRRSS